MRVFGVTNHTPEQVVEFLLRGRYVKKAAEIGIVAPDSSVGQFFKFVLLLTVADFSKNYTRLSTSGCNVFVFSNPIDLLEYEGLVLADCTQTDDFTFSYGPLSINLRGASSIRKTRVDFLGDLIANVRQGSLLTPLMTFIYTLSPQSQKVIKLLSVEYLYGTKTNKRLVAEASNVLTPRAVEKLTEILSTSSADTYKAAFAQLRTKKADVALVAERTGTSAYELSYMLSVLSNKKSTYTDSMDKAKNRKVKRD